MERSRLRSLLANLGLAAASTLLTVVILEAGVRLVTGDRYLDVDFRGRRGDLVYEPGQHFRWKRIEWDIDIKTNSKGLRDHEYPDRAPHAAVALGDSFTEGYGVQLEESWGRRLAAELEKAGKPWRVYISGVQGLQPVHYYAMYDRFWKEKPDVDLVVMGFCVGTDLESVPGEPVVHPPPMSTAYYIKRWLCEHSVLYNFIRRPARLSPVAQKVLMGLRLMRPLGLDVNWANEKYKKEWEFTVGRVLEFQKRLEKQGRTLVVMLIPNKEAVEEDFLQHSLQITKMDPKEFDPLAFVDYFSARGKKAGLPVLDLTRPLREANKTTPGAFYFKTDGHWKPAGHAFAAQELAAFLKAKKLGPFK